MDNSHVEGHVPKNDRRDRSLRPDNPSSPQTAHALARRQIINRYLPRHPRKNNPSEEGWIPPLLRVILLRFYVIFGSVIAAGRGWYGSGQTDGGDGGLKAICQ